MERVAVPTRLRTSRLLLRPWAASDAAALVPVLESNAAHIGPWIPAHVASPAPVPDLAKRLAAFAEDFHANRAWRYALLTPDATRVLGEADLFPRTAAGRVPLSAADRVELGYWLATSATGQGLATEATRALLDVAATLAGMTHAEIHCDAQNARSAAIPQRLGFHLAGMDGALQIWLRPLERTQHFIADEAAP